MRKIFIAFSALFLVYMIWPGPSEISDFKALPDSDKSKLAGDNIEQVPNVAGYFSNNHREFVVPFYLKMYQGLNKLPFPPLRLNHPPEYSWAVIKKHTDSTYLEELVYPLRSSFYVNGFEQYYSDGTPKFWGSGKFEIEGQSWFTKVTIRLYPSPLGVRILVWLGIISSLFLLFKLGKKIVFPKENKMLREL